MRTLFTIFALTLVSLAALSAQAKDAVLHVYAAGQEPLIRPVLDAYSRQSGVQVKLSVMDAPVLTSRIALEGKDTPADLVMVADVANLVGLAERGLLQQSTSAEVAARIPTAAQDPDGRWIGITSRARILFVRKDDIASQKAATSYESLTNPYFKGGVLVRSSQHDYNRSLVADMLNHSGEAATRQWLSGFTANLARKPEGADRDQLRALASGVGKVALANSYYFGVMLYGVDANDRALAEKLVPIFPKGNKGTLPAHVNLRGVGVLAHAKQPALARQLVDYLTQPEAQAMLATMNYEYPLLANVPVDVKMAQWGKAPAPSRPLAAIGEQATKAARLMLQAGWE